MTVNSDVRLSPGRERAAGLGKMGWHSCAASAVRLRSFPQVEFKKDTSIGYASVGKQAIMINERTYGRQKYKAGAGLLSV